jgi:pimeloyl-ACP methyl ester carboxylesterase
MTTSMHYITFYLLFGAIFVGAALTKFPKNTSEIIRGFGYPCEEHWAQTPDGYILSLQRIPHGLKTPKATKGAVLFQHGLTDNSAGACLNPPYESLPFILADAGYDVWLGNNRGNGISMRHIKFTPKDPQFWDFSWDEMALYDFPKNINYILQVTKASKISYIGHSEGTIQAFAGLILNPSLAQKLHLYVALAPVAFVGHVESTILQALANLDTVAIFELLGVHEFNLPNAIHKLLPGFCHLFPKICEYVSDALNGPTTFFNTSRLDYYLHFEPNPTSVKNMVHWSQAVQRDSFEMYDYGYDGNIRHYNQPQPPKYDLSKFPSNLTVALFCGGNDYLADPTDVRRLISLLPKAPLVHWEPQYAHLDPLLGINAYQRIYPRIIELLGKFHVNNEQTISE